VKRYRIYKVLKWIFAGWALFIILSSWAASFGIFREDTYTTGVFRDTNEAIVQVLLGIVNAVLAIFFKLQEDSNKPTVKE